MFDYSLVISIISLPENTVAMQWLCCGSGGGMLAVAVFLWTYSMVQEAK